jgi:predicted nucleotide-binding protein
VPAITGKAFYKACVALATIHFPDDKEVNGIGPRGLLWGMYPAVTPSHVGGKDPDPVSGAKSVAVVLERIMKNRPPLDLEKPAAPDNSSLLDKGRKRRRSGAIRVFVVHGHDGAAKHEVARFCEHLGLQPIVLHEQANQGRTIIEKFEGHADVDFAIVLLTADDVGYPRNRPEEARPRARQNAIFEWGYFVGTLGRARVCALYEDGVEIPSDYNGVLYVAMDSHGAWKHQLARELRVAGVDLNSAVLE